MEKIMRPVWAEIDLDILANNMKNIKKLAGNKEVIAVVKVNKAPINTNNIILLL